MYGGELLETSHSPKPEHRPLPSPKGEVGVLRSVVLVATDLLAVFVSNLFHCRAIRGAAISHYDLRVAVSLSLIHI